MAAHHAGDIRNLAFVGHGAAGKTTLADALLFKAGAVTRRGSVDDGTSVSDVDDEEHKRKISIDSAALHLEHQGKYIQIMDAPGYPDFVGSALGALNPVENAFVVLNAGHGIEVNARRMFKEAGTRCRARFVILNKLDADNIHFDELLESIWQGFGKQCVLLNAPIGIGANFKGVVSVLEPPAQPPADCPVDLATARNQLVEAVVECDDALTEKYLSEGDISNDELIAAIPKALAAKTLIPILCTSAKKDIGVPELLDAIARFALPPSSKSLNLLAKGPSTQVNEAPADENAEFVGQVFKVINDKFVGHLSFVRILSGKLKDHATIHNARTGKSSHIGALLRMQGNKQESITEAVAGDIIAIAKVDDLTIGDTIGANAHVAKLPLGEYPQPMFGLAVEPKARGDEQKISTSLHKIADEDPTFKITRDPQTHELVIAGISQLHLDVIRGRLKKRFDLEVVTHEPKIPYRETITAEAPSEHKHKKQTGGRGQFGEVHMRIYPLPREIKTQQQLEEQFANKSKFEKMRSVHYDSDYNFAFIDHIVGGTIPNQFMPAVEKGCKELLDRGALAGYRMQDMAVEVHFGKYHDVDSSEAAFKTAGRLAFKKAVLAARPVLMEPIVDLEVTLPSKYTGAILGDLNTKRARVDHQDSLPGDLAVIHAKVPLAEVTKYAAQLGSITQGQGAYTMHFSHYDTVPGQVQQQIVAKAAVTHDDEE
ncbi:MAG: elongation factor G [Gemmataceae bacterium]